MSDHEVVEALYHKLEKALDILKHEGHAPWFDLYYYTVYLLAKQQSNIQSRRRRSECLNGVNWGRTQMQNYSRDTPIDWDSSKTVATRCAEKICQILEEKELTNPDIDALALCYNVLNRVDKRYEGGMFFTPPRLARFIVEMLAPNADESVMGPASGTGLFLKEVGDYIEKETPAYKRYAALSIEKIPLLCVLSRVGVGARIHFGDALDTKLPKIFDGGFDVVFANPPFGVNVEDEIANQYKLASTPVSSKSESLFIERAIRLARPRIGRIALILSEEVFENPKYTEVLDYINEHTQLISEYRLPRSTFRLSGTDVKTRLLFLRKTEKKLTTEPKSVEINDLSQLTDGSLHPLHTLAQPITPPLYHNTSYYITHQTVLPRDEHDWSEIIHSLHHLREMREEMLLLEDIHVDDKTGEMFLHSTEGAIRDFVMDYLDLRLFDGLDGDVLEIFTDVGGSTSEARQHEAFQIAKEHTMHQVRKGNTFFFDPLAMSDIPELGPIVAKIMDVRNKQVLRLEKNPPLVDVYSTYYGFTVLTQGSIGHQVSGATDEAIGLFSQLASQIGHDLNLNHKQLKYSKNAFGRVSEYTRKLLWNLLSLSTAGQNNRRRAIRELGKLRDSRALPLLHTKIQMIRNEKTRFDIIEALTTIQHQSSIEVLKELPRDDWRLKRTIEKAMRKIEGR